MAERRPPDPGAESGSGSGGDELDGLDGGSIAEALEKAIGGSVPPEEELASLQAAVQADLAAETGLVASLRSFSTPVRVLLGLAVVIAVPVAAVLIAPRPALDLHPLFFGAVALSALVLI